MATTTDAVPCTSYSVDGAALCATYYKAASNVRADGSTDNHYSCRLLGRSNGVVKCCGKLATIQTNTYHSGEVNRHNNYN